MLATYRQPYAEMVDILVDASSPRRLQLAGVVDFIASIMVRGRERDEVLPDGTTHAGRTPAHWRRVALIVASMTGKRVSVDTATRMLERGDRMTRRRLRGDSAVVSFGAA